MHMCPCVHMCKPPDGSSARGHTMGGGSTRKGQPVCEWAQRMEAGRRTTHFERTCPPRLAAPLLPADHRDGWHPHLLPSHGAPAQGGALWSQPAGGALPHDARRGSCVRKVTPCVAITGLRAVLAVGQPAGCGSSAGRVTRGTCVAHVALYNKASPQLWAGWPGLLGTCMHMCMSYACIQVCMPRQSLCTFAWPCLTLAPIPSLLLMLRSL